MILYDLLKSNDIRKKKSVLPFLVRRNRIIAQFCAIIWQHCIPTSWRNSIDEFEKVKPRVKIDLIFEYIYADFEPEEYFRYGFEKKTFKEKRDYMSRAWEVSLYRNSNYNILPNGKYARYQLLKPLFKREIICIQFNDSEQEQNEFDRFIQKHESFMIKPVDGYCGNGVKKVTRESVPTLKRLKELTDASESILEELIVAGDEISRFHPQSINTIRMVTSINTDGQFSVLYAMLRIGIGDSVVDNIGSGGMGILIDISTGKLKTKGLKTVNSIQFYDKHPDSGIAFLGYQLPKWQSVCNLAEKAHKTMEKQLILGWDFAWNQKEEWDVVEVNPAPGSKTYQTIEGGIIPLLKEHGCSVS